MDDVIVAEDVLTAQGNGDGPTSELLFLVKPHPGASSGEVPRIAAAAGAAADRFGLVDATGRERPTQTQGASPLGPGLLDDAVVVGARDDDGISPERADTMLRVLLGELHSRKVGARVSCAPAGTDVAALPHPNVAPDEQAPVSTEAKRWFVLRGVEARTTTGKKYVDLDWLRPDGSWSRNDELARSFDNTRESMAAMEELVVRLREEALADPVPGRHEVLGVLLTPGAGNPSFERPPATIRDHGHVWRDVAGDVNVNAS